MAQVSERAADTKGKVLVLEYHHLKTGKGGMFRSPSDFRDDLERLYAMGFRPVTVSQYLADKMPLGKGASPVVLTFDDSNPTQFRMLPDGTVDPQCAVGVWEAFAKTHPDFPVRGTFYVLPDVMWAQPALVAKKVAVLKQLGSELANHTTTHPMLSKLSDEKVKQELGHAADKLTQLGVPMPTSMALPFGISPKNRELTKAFDWNGKHYSFTGVMLVGAEPARSPSDPKLNRFRVPRIQAYPGPSGSDYWLGLVKKGLVKVYVQP